MDLEDDTSTITILGSHPCEPESPAPPAGDEQERVAQLPQLPDVHALAPDHGALPRNLSAASPRSPAVSPKNNPLLIRRSLRSGKVSSNQLVSLRRAFAQYDVNGDGTIDFNELDQVLRNLGVEPKENQGMKATFAASLDTDNDGGIGFDEFVTFYKSLEGFEGKTQRVTMAEKVLGGDDTSLQAASASEQAARLLAVASQQREREENHEDYLTEKKRAVRQRIHGLLYDLPSFAPDYVYRRWWDVVILIIILYYWIVAPVQGIFGIEPDYMGVIVEVFLSGILIVDILICLNTAVQAEKRSFALVVQRQEILRSYALSGGLAIDILAGFPFDVLMWYIYGLTAWRAFRFLRILKVLKLRWMFVQVDRGSMDPAYVQFYFWTVPLIRLLATLVFIGHLMTLGRMMIASFPEPRHVCTGDEEFGLDACTSNIVYRYLLSLWWCWALLTTQGLARIESGYVYAYAALVMLMSLLLQGHVVAFMSALLTKSDVKEQHRETMRSTLAIMRQYGIPNSLQQEVLSFQYHSLQQNAASGFTHILDKLPAPMQKEVGLYVRVDLIAKVPMFEHVTMECKLDLANCLEQTYCEPDCFIIEYGEQGDEMYFMMHGFADVIIPSDDSGCGLGTVVNTIKRGDFFGEIALLNPQLTRQASIQALTYCDMFQLHNTHFRKLLSRYADLRNKVEAEAHSRGLNTKAHADDDTPDATRVDTGDGQQQAWQQSGRKPSDTQSVGSRVLAPALRKQSAVLHPPSAAVVKSLFEATAPMVAVDNPAREGVPNHQISTFAATKSFRRQREQARRLSTSATFVEQLTDSTALESCGSDDDSEEPTAYDDKISRDGFRILDKRIKTLQHDNRKILLQLTKLEVGISKLIGSKNEEFSVFKQARAPPYL
ncbi:putative potassium channel AKT5 [Diplonema papillatum]|nr:putative potassium channel AKT5 [Diplonema papillatum]